MDELTRIALVGTSKHSAAANFDMDHPGDALVAKVADGDRERTFLLRAGLHAVFQRCGYRPMSDLQPVTPCPAESRPFASARLVGALQNAMASDSWDLLKEFLRQLHARELLIPAELLPQALATSDLEVRELLMPVIGERGKWLSQFNREWNWVTAGIDVLSGRDLDALTRRWDEGTISDRCQVLRTLRRSDPEAARTRLETVIDSEKPDHRVRLLETLSIGLTTADEPFLSGRLGDRSEWVRRTAAALLARLPETALSQRMRERATGMLSANTRGIFRKKLRIACTPPEQIDKSWEKDGISAKAPQGRGKRAFWTESVLALVPPSFWCRKFDADPQTLIAGIADDDFVGAVLVGWTRAAAQFSAVDSESAKWLRPLWDYWSEAQRRGGKAKQTTEPDVRQALLQAMPGAEAESSLAQVFERDGSGDAESELGMLPLLPRPWSTSFAGCYLRAARRVLARRSDNRAYQWANSLVTASRALPPDSFSDALTGWTIADSSAAGWHTQAVQRELEKFVEVIRIRQGFYDEISQS